MNQKSREKEKSGLEARPSDEKRGKREPARRAKPQWPTGLRLPPAKDVTCFIPKALEAEGIDVIDVSGGFFV